MDSIMTEKFKVTLKNLAKMPADQIETMCRQVLSKISSEMVKIFREPKTTSLLKSAFSSMKLEDKR